MPVIMREQLKRTSNNDVVWPLGCTTVVPQLYSVVYTVSVAVGLHINIHSTYDMYAQVDMLWVMLGSYCNISLKIIIGHYDL